MTSPVGSRSNASSIDRAAKGGDDGESAPPAHQKHTSRRTRPSRASDHAAIALSLVIFLVCVAALVFGLSRLIIVRADDQGSYSQSRQVAGWGIGFAVQAALLSLMNFGRALCQVWFAHRITSEGMGISEMMAAWSALYSGSFRGMEDILGGRSPIALVLMVLYVGEVFVLAAIGSLYYVEPLILKTGQGRLPAMVPLAQNMPAFDSGYAADTLAGHIGTVMLPLYRDAVIAGPEFQNYTEAKCSPDGTECEITKWGIAHPVNVSLLDTEKSKPADWIPAGDTRTITATPNFEQGDIIHANMTAFGVSVRCAPSKDLQLVRAPWNPDQTWYIATAAGVTPELHSMGIIAPYFHLGHPEISVQAMINATDAVTGDARAIHITEQGDIYIVLIARSFGNDTNPSFTYIDDPIAGGKVGLSKCTVGARIGQAFAQLQVMHTVPTTVTRIVSMDPPVFPPNAEVFDLSRAVPQIIGRIITMFTCVTWQCPLGDALPWFDVTTGLATSVPQTKEEESKVIGNATAAVADVTLLLLAALSVPGVGSDVPYEVYSGTSSSILIMTPSCAAVLVIGAACSLLLSLIYTFFTFASPRLTSGVRITDSIYCLLDYFQAPVVYGTGKGNRREPTEVKRALKDRALKLVEEEKEGSALVRVESWLQVGAGKGDGIMKSNKVVLNGGEEGVAR